MEYYKLIKTYNDTHAVVAKAVKLDQYNEYLYTEQKILHWNEDAVNFSANVTSPTQLRDVLRNDIDYLLFSHRLKTLIESNALTGASFYKINLNYKDEIFTPYWYTHLIYLEGVFDYEASQYNWFGKPPQVAGVTKVGFHADRAAGYDIFRIPENKPAVYVSENFKKIFGKNQLTGAEFLPVKLT